ncbi:hypothetical protein CDCA_CDCA01G0357 [Cyanidium caldarium]|uniref:Peroxisomal ATPase PEX1 n=1 Tax=Cyanidium caldarium TaxID=2771 RepID=A0AAV9IQ01_CYACA|nr:hypothetical protein CDCA_CDCA01G0357 [Cyanidium caldarium]
MTNTDVESGRTAHSVPKTNTAAFRCGLRVRNDVRDSFVAVPPSLAAVLERELAARQAAEALPAESLRSQVVPLRIANRLVCCWHRGRLSQTVASRLRAELEVGAAVAECAGLVATDRSAADGPTSSSSSEVSVEILPLESLRTAHRLVAQALTDCDWQLLQVQHEYLERELLRQLRVVHRGQLLPVYGLAGDAYARLRVQHIEPAPVCRDVDNAVYWLNRGTEIVVQPPAAERAEGVDEGSEAVQVQVVRVLPVLWEEEENADPVVEWRMHPSTAAAMRKREAKTEALSNTRWAQLSWRNADDASETVRVNGAVRLDERAPPAHVMTRYAPPYRHVHLTPIAEPTETSNGLEAHPPTFPPLPNPTVLGEACGRRPWQRLVDALTPVFTVPPKRDRQTTPAARVVLLGGPPGCGKTYLATATAVHWARQPPYFPQPVHLSCRRAFRGALDQDDGGGGVEALLQQALSALCSAQPTILVLDDVDALAASPSGTADESTIGRAPALDQLAALLERCQRMLQVAVILTVTVSATNNEAERSLLPPRRLPCTLIHERIGIRLPTASDRTELLGGTATALATRRTPGAVPADLLKLRARLEVWQGDVQRAQAHFQPRALLRAGASTAATAPPDGVRWGDIGALSEAQQTLVDTIVLRLRFPQVFARAPIRVQSGVLLYGPTGCGKTLLVRALVNRYRLRMVSVKGPELLNKYVGASEAAVRDVFARARQARPCILFFDEFESLAPRRGGGDAGGATGVTDRVVNALLTEMDGVEPLSDGVFVVAATSRPDLVDPALLRPGRIDRWVRVPLPQTPAQRYDIVRRLQRRLALPLAGTRAEQAALLRWLAERTEGYVGADLYAVFADAQLNRERAGREEAPPMTPADFERVLASRRLSLPPAERERYEHIVRRFEVGRSGLDDDLPLQRVVMLK